jgi:hypothetical protein
MSGYIKHTLNKYNCETVEDLQEFLEKAENLVHFLKEEQDMNENLRKWFQEKWVRFNPQGKIMGPCARGNDKEGKPKCLPQKKAHTLGKKGRASAAAKKRREDPNPERSGKAINVATKKKTDESCWSTHKQVGMKKKGDRMVPNCVPKESVMEIDFQDTSNKLNFILKNIKPGIRNDRIYSMIYNRILKRLGPANTPEKKQYYQILAQDAMEKYLRNTQQVDETSMPKSFHETMAENLETLREKKDACYHKVKSRYKVWPSAYASGALVKCRKVGAKNWGTKSESISENNDAKKQKLINTLISLDNNVERNYLELATLDELQFMIKKALSKTKNKTDDIEEGQIYSGGYKPAGMRWYEPRKVPNQDELYRKESAIMKGIQTEGNDEEFHTGGGKGLPKPGTYEEETLPYRTKGQRRTQAIAFEDQIEEYSSEKLEKYSKKAQEDMARHAALAKLARIEHDEEEAEHHELKSFKREKGLTLAQKKRSLHDDEND